MTHSLVPMGSAKTILENFPASAAKAGRELCAIMVMLPLIHYKITFFVMGVCVVGTGAFVVAHYTCFLY